MRISDWSSDVCSSDLDAGKQFQQGRFSGSVGSDQPKGLARAHGEIDARDDREAARRPAEVLRFECHLETFPRSRIRAKAGAPTSAVMTPMGSTWPGMMMRDIILEAIRNRSEANTSELTSLKRISYA